MRLLAIHSDMRIGIVSNCWQRQLAQGEALEALIEQAARLGYALVELRQTCLGRFETAAEHRPQAGALAELPQRFPEMEFNLALAFPFFHPSTSPDAPLFQAGIEAAEALAGKFTCHLRLVDLATAIEDPSPAMIEDSARNLVELARRLARRQGRLSLENARQPWSVSKAVFARARELLGTDAACLRLCYDAVNLLDAADRPDPAKAVRSLHAAEISMVHFKQRRNGAALPALGEGDIAWQDQLDALSNMEYQGPGLFELPPHDQFWDHLQQSREYLARELVRFGRTVEL